MSSTLEARVAALERGRRFRSIACGLAGGLALAGFLTAGSPDVPDRIVARSVDIVREDGTVVVHLGIRSSGAGGVWLTNAEGARVLKLNQDAAGAGRIAVLDEAGREIGVIARGGDGTVALVPVEAPDPESR